jgi:hypothetical protein
MRTDVPADGPKSNCGFLHSLRSVGMTALLEWQHYRNDSVIGMTAQSE